jgi:hypothetical protein
MEDCSSCNASPNGGVTENMSTDPARTTYFRIPTYDPESEAEYDYARSHALTIQEVDGLRVVMGDAKDKCAPDVLIERAVGLWRIFVHADGGEPLCVIEIQRFQATIGNDRGETLLEQHLGWNK